MKSSAKILSAFVCSALFLALGSFSAQSAPIYTFGDTPLKDTDRGSFVDLDTGLEWMDFGIVNNLPLSHVLENLSEGGDYYGWRMPNENEVNDLWRKVFYDRIEGPTLSDGQGESYEEISMNFIYWGGYHEERVDEWDKLFDIISYNQAVDIGTGYGFYYGLGWFYSTDGTIDYARFQLFEKWSGETGYAQVYQGGDYQRYLDVVSPYTAPFLVKGTVEVTEPESFIVLLLSIFLILRARKTC
ncbi:hypothetical protein HHX48_17845 [Salinimonas sp. HHU 13199]|uniref:DUF1566 domain-containing protein n=1 Tax=Salinimonas profundi TaxID=2729140 RepID=A0ABR8LN48_9ALTE|nr:hypothetical protein [Salinimonas profundi]MBD3587605.1 hypothetical protein [Salinimonas profundi]